MPFLTCSMVAIGYRGLFPMGYHASASRPERRNAGGLSPPIHIGGCGFWTGCGANRTLLNDTNSPSNSGSSLAPQLLEGLQVFVAHRAPPFERRRSKRLELFPHPSHPASGDQAAAGQHVDRRKHLGRVHRVAVRQDEDRRKQVYLRRRRRQERDDRELFETFAWIRAREFTGKAVRVTGSDVFRDDDVVAHADEVEPHLLAVLGDRHEGVGCGEGTAGWNAESVLHVMAFRSGLRVCLKTLPFTPASSTGQALSLSKGRGAVHGSTSSPRTVSRPLIRHPLSGVVRSAFAEVRRRTSGRRSTLH